MLKLILTLSLLFSTVCIAEPLELQIPGRDWKLKIDIPDLKKINETNTESQYYYLAKSDRINLSLTVAPPNCVGGVSVEDNYRCFIAKVENVPGIVKQTIKAEKVSTGIQVIYLIYANVGDKAIKIMNTHILFMKNGLWGDLHVSVVKPTIEEITMLVQLADKFEVLE